jgi:hypothetical protein
VFDAIASGLRGTAFHEACTNAARRILPSPILIWLRSRMVGTLQGDPREVFSEIYQRNIWGLRETVSGAGSTLRYTEKLRQSIPGLIADLNIRTLLDVPCVDFHWMSEIEMPDVHYIGGEIVPGLVEATRNRSGRPNREFRAIDLCNDSLPGADLLLCRDCLIHLSEEMNFLALANILRSDIKYLLTTTYPNGRNRSIRNGDWFALNLCAPPYNFPPPIRMLDDWLPPFDRRQLALWEIESLRHAIGRHPALELSRRE